MKKVKLTYTVRSIAAFMTAVFTVFCLALAGCAPKEAEKVLNVAALKGPTGMGLAYMMKEQTDKYNVELYDTPDAVTGKFISGEIDVAAVPINLASVLYNKTQGEAVLIGVNTLGVLYILSTGENVNDLADLAGKKLYATGEASTPEYVLNRLLEKNGLSGAVEVEYIAEHATLAGMMAAGEADLAMLPEPNVTSVMLKNPDAHIVIDMTEEWDKVENAQLVQGCYIARRSVVQETPGVINAFLSDTAASVEKVNSAKEAPALIAELGIVGSEAIAEIALPNCHIVCLTDGEMRSSAEEMLKVLFDADPKSVGGKLPGDDFYYEVTNGGK